MSTLVFLKLLAIFAVVALGWVAGKLRWLGDNDPARTLSNAAFYIFIPALLFRTTARVEFGSLPWATLAAFFVSVLTALVEMDLARERRRQGQSNAHLLHTVGKTARNTIIHPVVLPVLAGLVWNALLPPLPAVADEVLVTMSQAVVPLCLVLIGM